MHTTLEKDDAKAVNLVRGVFDRQVNVRHFVQVIILVFVIRFEIV